MPKAITRTDQQQVTEHIRKLEPTLGKIVETIRQIILSTDKEVGERIKWNNPSFYYNGEMKDFDPKEYKREILVLNLHKNRVMLVFPSGAKVNDKTGFLEGSYSDGRRLAILKDLKHLQSRKKDIQSIISKWLTLVEK